ncbi:DUF1134 domain-containing protein [Gammaproteobacteria bacterium]
MLRPFTTLFLSLTLALTAYYPHDSCAAINIQAPPGNIEETTYDQTTIIEKASTFFGDATEGLAKAIESSFQKHGRPNSYIEGQEVGGAMTVGVRYGDGMLISHNGSVRRIYWQGPSLGFDLGLNAAKVFTLVYHLPDIDAIFQRFPGVEGSLYYFAGFGVTYLENNGIVLVPIRLGVGFRTGASVGYLNITSSPSWNPF